MRKQNSFFELPLFLLQPEIDLEDCVVRQPKRGQPPPQGANRPEPGEPRGPLRGPRPRARTWAALRQRLPGQTYGPGCQRCGFPSRAAAE